MIRYISNKNDKGERGPSSVRPLFHPEPHEIRLEEVFHALSDPVRMEIVRKLAAIPEQFCGEFEFGLKKSTLSHHFRVLREAGVTRTRIAGTQRFMSLRRQDLEDRFPGLVALILRDAPSSPDAPD